MQFNCQNTIRPGEKKRLNYAYMLKNGVGRYSIFFFFFLRKAWAATKNWYSEVGHGCRRCFFWKKRLSENIICFPSLWKKKHNCFPILLKKNDGGGGVDSISPRRKTFKIFNTKFGVVILKIMVGKISRNIFFWPKRET